jgi:hypothetical protein
MEIDQRPEFTISPTNGGSKSIEMDVGTNGGADPRIKFEVDGVARLLVPPIKLCQCFKRLHMACPFMISSVPTLLCSTKPLCLIPPHLMSLFSTLTMDLATFLSRFLPRNLILGSSTYMKHKQPSTLH